ncbi:RING-H2 finger protein ATL40-like [Cornus florida]|uniref:RING-H2 finger protein ATL40-like n=1 Tax=Cornus florida TaxID=4283 RepID=UPI00289E7DB7|nr:RING-H2 finger protein ATL40-like [Cornus florida]
MRSQNSTYITKFPSIAVVRQDLSLRRRLTLPPIPIAATMSKDDDDDGFKFGTAIKIMLVVMCSLIGIITIIIIFHIFCRYLHRRRERRRRNALFPLSITTVVPSDVNMGESPKTGLDQSVIESLPKFSYKASEGLDHVEAIECSVCLSTIVEKATVRLLPNCKHLFHADCIGMWLSSHTTCPNCRTLAEPRVQPTAPPLLLEGSAPELGTGSESEKVGGSSSRLSSFRRILLSRERSSRRVQSCGEEVFAEGLER